MAKVTFDDKVDLTTKDVPEINKITADNINQLKNGVNSNEVAINAISQGAGTPFDNLTDAMVSPLADGQPFFTTVTDRGQYFYDSTTAEGYVLDHLFYGEVNTGVFDDNSDSPASQKVISKKIESDIKDALFTRVEESIVYDSSYLVNNTRISSDGTSVTASSVDSTNFINIENAIDINVTLIQSSANAGLAYYSADNESAFISFVIRSGADATLIETLVPPENATHLRTTFWDDANKPDSTDFNLTVNKVTYIDGIVEQVTENTNSITTINEDILLKKSVSYDDSYLTNPTRIREDGGVSNASSVSSTPSINVEGATNIDVTLIQSGSDAGLVFYDGSGAKVSAVIRSGANATLIETLPVPAGAVNVKTTFWNESTKPDSTDFSLVVNFIDDKKINEKVLDNSDRITEVEDVVGYLPKLNYSLNLDKLVNYSKKSAMLDLNYQANLIIGLHGDSWTHLTNTFCMYPTFLSRKLRDKYGNGGGGWYDFGASNGGSQFFRSIDPLDATDTRVGTFTYIDEGSNALGINCGHVEIGANSTITLNVLTAHEKFVIHYISNSSYGVFRYRIDGGGWTSIDSSITDAYNTIEEDVTDATHTIEFEVVSGTCVILGVDMQRNEGARIHKFGNRGLKASDVLDVNAELWKDAVSAFDLDVFTTLLGTNDRNSDIAPSTYANQMKLIRDLVVDANSLLDFLYIVPSTNERVTAYSIEEYNDALYALAKEDDTHLISLIPLFGDLDKILDLGLFYDADHPTVIMGNAISNKLLREVFN